MTVNKMGHKKGRRQVKALLVDLDDTLYRCEKIPAQVKVAIQRYMVAKLGVPEDEVVAKCTQLYTQYGTTLAGLTAAGYSVDYDDWHKDVHYELLDYNQLLKPDIMLRELLCSIDVPKYILTNADRVHAERCLARLGISDCFQGIFDFEWAIAHGGARGALTEEHPILCKPSHTIYHYALEAIQCHASEVLFFDDSPRNILAAHEVGIMTCLVGRDTLVPGADLAIPSMHYLPSHMPELMDQPGLVHDCHEHGELEQESVAPLMVAQGSGSN